MDHDLQRLRKIREEGGGDAGVVAAEICKSPSAPCSCIYIGATANTLLSPVRHVQDVRDTQPQRALENLTSSDNENKRLRDGLTKRHHTRASLIKFVITFRPTRPWQAQGTFPDMTSAFPMHDVVPTPKAVKAE